jgi:predicted metal-dependent hydrolase
MRKAMTWLGIFKKGRRRPATAYLVHKEAARSLIVPRVQFFAQQFGITYRRIAIRNTRRSWGSCSEKGNLNFSYKLLFFPPCLRDYVIVHELCHRLVLNHSPAFWSALTSRLLDARERARTLRQFERTHYPSLSALRQLLASHQKCEKCTAIIYDNSTSDF